MDRSERNYGLRIRDLMFCLSVIVSLIIIAVIPFEDLFQSTNLQAYSEDLDAILSSVIVVFGCWQIGKMLHINVFIRSRAYMKSKYWLLLLPLFYPGLLYLSNFSVNCYTGFDAMFFFFTTLLISGIFEEVVFRGLIQGYLIQKYPYKSYHQVCIITAFFFSLIHLNNLKSYVLLSVINQVIYAFYMGLLFSALMIRTGNTWLTGIIHGVLNILSTTCSGKETSTTIIQGALGSHLAQIAGVILVFSPTLLIYWVLLRGIKRQTVIGNT